MDKFGFVGETVYLAEVCHPTQWKTLPTSELLDEGFSSIWSKWNYWLLFRI